VHLRQEAHQHHFQQHIADFGQVDARGKDEIFLAESFGHFDLPFDHGSFDLPFETSIELIGLQSLWVYKHGHVFVCVCHASGRRHGGARA
jgi:hypothetical protein